MNKSFIDKLQFNENGLIPAIAQDWLDGTILMMAWMNQTALEETINKREVHYWSRSREKLWHKGETSGHKQLVKGIRYDCDSDVILLTVKQVGDIACHTGERSCFFKDVSKENQLEVNISAPPADLCSEVFKIVKERKNNPKIKSYTNSLLEGGENRILKKIGEESAEFVMACKDKNLQSISNEAADLIFHIQVALALNDVDWKDVLEVLASRKDSKRTK